MSKWPLLSAWSRGAVAVIGLALLIAGVVATFVVNSAGSVAMVLAGGTLLVAPFLASRLVELSLGTQGVSFKLSREIAELGAPDTARKLEGEGLSQFAYAYAFVREQLDHHERVKLQDALVAKAKGVAVRESLDSKEVRELFRRGSPVLRVLSLGLMEGDPSLADIPTLTSAIAESRTANEQYHGLKLAQQLWPRMTRNDRQLVKAAIAGAGYWNDDRDSEQLGRELLDAPVDDR